MPRRNAPRTARFQEKRDTILAAAARQFNARGVRGATLGEIGASVLVDGLVDGSIRPMDPAIAAQLLSSAINAAAELQRWVPGIAPDNVTQRCTRPALQGLLCSA